MNEPERPKYAYPTLWDNGMELRDWLAGLAMQSLLQRSASTRHIEDIPEVAYLLADSMLDARDKEGDA